MMLAQSRTPVELGYRMPAEWEPHRATWLAWPHAPDWPGKAGAIPWVFAEMARQLAAGERVVILVRDRAESRRASRVLERAHVNLSRVDFFRAPTNRSWTRDYLPTWVVKSVPAADQAGGRLPRLGAVKWRFNGWARYRDYALDEAAGLQVARWLGGPVFLPEVGSGQRRRRVVLEGGALDVDGQGSVVVSEECLLTGQRARFKTVGRAEVERLLMAYLGVSRVLWVERGIVGDDTSGHVDDFVRFVAPGRLVLCEERRAADANHRPLSRARECLAGCRDAQGRRLEIIPLPMPDPVFFGPHRLPASYANFYLGNTVVLVPTFNDKADRQALGILAELFPGRRVVGIHALDLVLGLGTLHCSTQPEPFGRARRPRSWTS